MTDTEKRFRVLRRIFFFTGNAMFGDGTSVLYKIYSFTGPLLMYINWIAMVVDTLQNMHDLSRMIENVSVVLPHICALWIFIYVRTHKEAIQKLMYLTDQFTWEDYPARDEKTGSLTMAGFVPKYQKIVIHMIWTTVVPHSSYMVMRGIMSRDMLGFNAWLPFDTRPSPIHEIVIFIQIFCSAIITCNFWGNLCFYATLVTIACTQLQKVNEEFKQLQKEDFSNKSNGNLNACIEFHQNVLRFMYSMQEILNILIFGHFVVIIVGMAFACFGAVMSWGHPGELYQLAVVFTGQLAMLAIYCVLGTEVSRLAEEVRFSVYNSEWIGSSISAQRTLTFVMAAANNDFKIAAGGFIPVTRETMLAILNQAFSYMMFLLNFRDAGPE